jgi:hypothetical protein
MFRVLFLLLCSFPPALPQKPTELHVRVLDPSRQPVPQAGISVSNQSSGKIINGKTSASGDFVLPLAPGQYQLDIQRDGFEEQRTTVTIGQRNQQITVALSIKKERISVTVSEQAAKLDTSSDSHQDSLKLDASDLSGLPVRDGDILSAVAFFANPAGGQSPTIIVGDWSVRSA